jgi:hypothetical protein
LSTKDLSEWYNILDEFTLKDPHYLREYLNLFESLTNRDSYLHFGGQGIMFTYGDSRNYIIYPFFKRDISALPFANKSVGLFDIVSPYGYGGPLAETKDDNQTDELWRDFFSEFHVFCLTNNIVCEFVRLHPIFDNAKFVTQFSKGNVEQMGKIVYLDLSKSEEEILSEISPTRRRDILKANRNPDLKLYSSLDKINIDEFYILYSETMKRNGAENKFFFTSDFFHQAVDSLDDNLILLRCSLGDRLTVSSTVLLRFGGICYYWLSASLPESRNLHSIDLSIYRAALMAKRKGDKFLVLGGGRGAKEDPLFAFKKQFSSKSKEFSVYKQVHLEKEYAHLVKLRNDYYGITPGNFFPAYRG